jgi:hypothetical protein
MHQRHLTQTIPCISRTAISQPGHSLLQDSMPDDEELDCAPSKRKMLNWTPFARLNSSGHRTGFSNSKDFNKEKVLQDWTSVLVFVSERTNKRHHHHCQQLGMPIPHLYEFIHHECPCKRFAIDVFGDHLHIARNMRAPRWAHTSTYPPPCRIFTCSPRRDKEQIARTCHTAAD